MSELETPASHRFEGQSETRGAEREVNTTARSASRLPHGAAVSSPPHPTRTKSEPNLIGIDQTDMQRTNSQEAAIMQYLSRKARQAADSFLTEVGLAAEMPSTLIPNFSGKTALWAERVENILLSRGMRD